MFDRKMAPKTAHACACKLVSTSAAPPYMGHAAMSLSPPRNPPNVHPRKRNDTPRPHAKAESLRPLQYVSHSSRSPFTHAHRPCRRVGCTPPSTRVYTYN
ncbi:hypothetical protein BD779DRAFT_1554876 [Infundibulicybe gibba]|nr:hypothetical protein BD779DRAFT_1554876 [Infundibulicybe gibba]